jgi:hypothetical protein
VRQDPAPQVRIYLRHDECRQGWRLGLDLDLPEERPPVRLQDGLFWPVPLVAAARETVADR